MNSKRICIIGAGIGGLTAGALLTKHGYKVKIFEKEPLIGGRALSFNGSSINLDEYKKLLSRFNLNVPFSEPDLKTIFEKNLLNGYKLDLGYHEIGGGVLSNVNSVLSELNDHVDILESYVGLIKEDGFDFPFLSKMDKFKILPKIFRLLFASEKTLKELDSISMTETIKRYGKGKMKLILEIFSRSITTINNLDKISTGEMLRAQRNLYKGSKPVGYPKGGLSSITRKFADYITQNGGEINLEKPVEKIIIKNNKATGVIVENKELSFDTVISNILVQDLFKIADEKHFPKEYVKEIKSLIGTGSLCAYYSLKKVDPSLIGKTFHFIERNVGIDGNDVVGMIDFMVTGPDAGLSPSGEYLIQSYIICTPDEARDKKILYKLRDLLDKNLRYLIPDFNKNLNWVIYPAIWHLDGVAKTIENEKPEIKTPVDNLYLIGDCVKALGIGFNCALNSARILTDILSNSNK
jgi:hypothetical protein